MLAASLLDHLGTWRTMEQLGRAFPELERTALERAVDLLERRTLVERSDRPRAADRSLASWASWNPAAGFLHFSTKDVPFTDAAPTGAVGPAAPAEVKRVRGVARIRLPAARHDDAVPRTLLARRTWRRFGSRPLPLADLATLLGLTFGIRRARLPGGGGIVLRTSPSPGARHALEAYVLVRRVSGLRPGLYHYAADRHELERLTSTATRRQLVGYLPTQHWYGDAAALVLVTAVFPRVSRLYDYPRAYRAVLAEAGHFCQTFLLAATWLGLAPFCSMALADSRIERDLGIDGVTESVLYAAGVGARPPGVDWAPLPAPKRGRMSR